MREIKRAEIFALIKQLKKNAPIGANRILAYVKKFFPWAIENDLVDDLPAASIKRPTSEKDRSRDRVLDDWEIRAFWLACGEMGAFGRAFASCWRPASAARNRGRDLERDRQARLCGLLGRRGRRQIAYMTFRFPTCRYPSSTTAPSSGISSSRRADRARADGGNSPCLGGWSKAKNASTN